MHSITWTSGSVGRAGRVSDGRADSIGVSGKWDPVRAVRREKTVGAFSTAAPGTLSASTDGAEPAVFRFDAYRVTRPIRSRRILE
jgi:hypothetical protein